MNLNQKCKKCVKYIQTNIFKKVLIGVFLHSLNSNPKKAKMGLRRWHGCTRLVAPPPSFELNPLLLGSMDWASKGLQEKYGLFIVEIACRFTIYRKNRNKKMQKINNSYNERHNDCPLSGKSQPKAVHFDVSLHTHYIYPQMKFVLGCECLSELDWLGSSQRVADGNVLGTPSVAAEADLVASENFLAAASDELIGEVVDAVVLRVEVVTLFPVVWARGEASGRVGLAVCCFCSGLSPSQNRAHSPFYKIQNSEMLQFPRRTHLVIFIVSCDPPGGNCFALLA